MTMTFNHSATKVLVLLLLRLSLILFDGKGVLGFSSFRSFFPRHQSLSSSASCRRASKSALASVTAATTAAGDPQETLPSLSIKLQAFVEQKQQDSSHDANLMTEEIARLLLFNTRVSNLHLNRTHIATSTVPGAGRGLFASCDCKQGDLLTCYPGDALVIIPDDEPEWTVLWGNHVSNPEAHDIDKLVGYMVHAYDDYGVVGLPSSDDNPAYLGHFANDGCVEIPTCEADLAPYTIESNHVANAMHDDLDQSHMVTTATRDIFQGEEIFVTYGPDYWSEQSSFGTSKQLPVNTDKDATKKKNKSSGRGFG